jgi:hypothetical protein
LQKVIVDLIDSVARNSDIVLVGRDRHDPTPPYRQSFQSEEQLTDQVHIAFHERSLIA